MVEENSTTITQKPSEVFRSLKDNICKLLHKVKKTKYSLFINRITFDTLWSLHVPLLNLKDAEENFQELFLLL